MRVTNEELSMACEVIKALEDMGLFADHRPEAVDWFIDEHQEELDDLGVCLSHGLSKVVIDYYKLDNWVLKVAIGSNYGCSDYIDHVALEYEIYQRAIADGFDFLLAEIQPGGHLSDGRAFFFQEMCICDEDARQDSLENYCRNTMEQESDESDEDYRDRIYDSTTDLDDEENCEALLGQDYRQDVIDRFTSWCWDNDINDLHAGNFGQRRNGFWCVIDHSGFH